MVSLSVQPKVMSELFTEHMNTLGDPLCQFEHSYISSCVNKLSPSSTAAVRLLPCTVDMTSSTTNIDTTNSGIPISTTTFSIADTFFKTTTPSSSSLYIPLRPQVVSRLWPNRGVVGGGQMVITITGRRFLQLNGSGTSNAAAAYYNSDQCSDQNDGEASSSSSLLMSVEVLIDEFVSSGASVVVLSDTRIALRIPDCAVTRQAGVHKVVVVLYCSSCGNVIQSPLSSSSIGVIQQQQRQQQLSGSFNNTHRRVQLRSDATGIGGSWLLLLPEAVPRDLSNKIDRSNSKGMNKSSIGTGMLTFVTVKTSQKAKLKRTLRKVNNNNTSDDSDDCELEIMANIHSDDADTNNNNNNNDNRRTKRRVIDDDDDDDNDTMNAVTPVSGDWASSSSSVRVSDEDTPSSESSGLQLMQSIKSTAVMAVTQVSQSQESRDDDDDDDDDNGMQINDEQFDEDADIGLKEEEVSVNLSPPSPLLMPLPAPPTAQQLLNQYFAPSSSSRLSQPNIKSSRIRSNYNMAVNSSSTGDDTVVDIRVSAVADMEAALSSHSNWRHTCQRTPGLEYNDATCTTENESANSCDDYFHEVQYVSDDAAAVVEIQGGIITADTVVKEVDSADYTESYISFPCSNRDASLPLQQPLLPRVHQSYDPSNSVGDCDRSVALYTLNKHVAQMWGVIDALDDLCRLRECQSSSELVSTHSCAFNNSRSLADCLNTSVGPVSHTHINSLTGEECDRVVAEGSGESAVRLAEGVSSSMCDLATRLIHKKLSIRAIATTNPNTYSSSPGISLTRSAQYIECIHKYATLECSGGNELGNYCTPREAYLQKSLLTESNGVSSSESGSNDDGTVDVEKVLQSSSQQLISSSQESVTFSSSSKCIFPVNNRRSKDNNNVKGGKLLSNRHSVDHDDDADDAEMFMGGKRTSARQKARGSRSVLARSMMHWSDSEGEKDADDGAGEEHFSNQSLSHDHKNAKSISQSIGNSISHSNKHEAIEGGEFDSHHHDDHDEAALMARVTTNGDVLSGRLQPLPFSLFSTEASVMQWRRQELIQYYHQHVCVQTQLNEVVSVCRTIDEGWRVKKPSAVQRILNDCAGGSVGEESAHSLCHSSASPSAVSLPRNVALYYMPLLGRMAQAEYESDMCRSLGLTQSLTDITCRRSSRTSRASSRGYRNYSNRQDEDEEVEELKKYRHLTAATGMSEAAVDRLLDYGFIGSHVRTNIRSDRTAANETSQPTSWM